MESWLDVVNKDMEGNCVLANLDAFLSFGMYPVVTDDAKLVENKFGSGPPLNCEGFQTGSCPRRP